jgi:hypothetical protein
MTEEELEKEVARVIDHQTGYVYTDATTLYMASAALSRLKELGVINGK